MNFKKELNEDSSSNMKIDHHQSGLKEMIFNNTREEDTEEIKLAGETKVWYSSKLIEDTMEAIRKNNMTAIFAKDRETALDEVLKRIPKMQQLATGVLLRLRSLA